MTIEYLKCGKDLNFDVDFRVNGVIGTIHSDNGSFLSIIYIFLFKNASYAFNLQVVRYLF